MGGIVAVLCSFGPQDSTRGCGFFFFFLTLFVAQEKVGSGADGGELHRSMPR